MLVKKLEILRWAKRSDRGSVFLYTVLYLQAYYTRITILLYTSADDSETAGIAHAHTHILTQYAQTHTIMIQAEYESILSRDLLARVRCTSYT